MHDKLAFLSCLELDISKPDQCRCISYSILTNLLLLLSKVCCLLHTQIKYLSPVSVVLYWCASFEALFGTFKNVSLQSTLLMAQVHCTHHFVCLHPAWKSCIQWLLFSFVKVLGLEQGATDVEIKQRYRALARQYHPDKNKDLAKEEAEKRFMEIQEAYETLSKLKIKRAGNKKH